MILSIPLVAGITDKGQRPGLKGLVSPTMLIIGDCARLALCKLARPLANPVIVCVCVCARVYMHKPHSCACVLTNAQVKQCRCRATRHSGEAICSPSDLEHETKLRH